MQVLINGTAHECARAIKGPDYVYLLDESGGVMLACSGISSFEGYSIEGGEWENVETPTEPTQLERIDALEAGVMELAGLIAEVM